MSEEGRLAREGHSKRGRRRAGLSERGVERVLTVIALSAIGVLGLITVFIFIGGLPAIAKTGLWAFVSGHKWAPGRGVFGIFPMIMGSLWVTVGALAIGVPLSLACAIFLAEVAPPKTARVVKPAIELLAGIPSVIYGFMGLVILVPLIRNHLGGPGFSVLASSVVLGIMILPTVISISYDAIKAVPEAYRDGSLALGATKWQTIVMVLLPAARSGVLAAIILGMGRAIGETMAVIMVAGNATMVPGSLLDPVRTLTSNIALEMGYAAGTHRAALFGTGVILFVIIMLLSILASFTTNARGKAKAR
ncbi:MAG: phosphate ABC transporter permease subunit PstC [Bacillota bacterium]